MRKASWDKKCFKKYSASSDLSHPDFFPKPDLSPVFFGHENVTNRRMHCILKRPHFTANNALLLSIMNKFVFLITVTVFPKRGPMISPPINFFHINIMLIIIYTNASLELCNSRFYNNFKKIFFIVIQIISLLFCKFTIMGNIRCLPILISTRFVKILLYTKLNIF